MKVSLIAPRTPVLTHIVGYRYVVADNGRLLIHKVPIAFEANSPEYFGRVMADISLYESS